MRILLVGLLWWMAASWAPPQHGEQRKTVRDQPPAVTEPLGVVPGAPVFVGASGNEPLIHAAPDGTLYISALQHIYRSDNNGANWIKLVGPPEASTLNVASDSSIWVDPGNRLYFTFDYPYAGTTAVCTTDDKGVTWSCNPAVVPGGTDRMWVLAPTTSKAYEVTNQGLYETAFLMSTDRGLTWTPKAIASGVLEPQSGPLLQKRCSNKIVQPIKIFGTTPSDLPELKLYVYDPETTGAILSDVRSTGLAMPLALPSGAFSADDVLYTSTEEANATDGRHVVVARSADEGATWTILPPIPATETGTATFSWVAAGEPGHVGVLYYYSTSNGNPNTMTAANWSAVWAESYNADTADPTWTVTTVENLIHTGAICIAADCSGTNRFAGDFISAIIDKNGAAHLTWMAQANGTGAISIHYQRIQSGPVPTYTPPPCGVLPIPVQLNSVVSSKTHGSAGTFDINLPVDGEHGVECRSGGANGDYTIVFTFQETLTSVGSATTTCGQVNSSAIGADTHQYIVNLTGMGACNAQPIFITLHAVQDSANHYSDVIAAPMSLLIGDTTADTFVNSADISQTKSKSGQAVGSSSFRQDVTIDGFLNSADISFVKSKSGTALP